MTKYCGPGHISKVKIIRKAKSSELSTDGVEAEQCPKKGFSIGLPRIFKLFGPKHKQILSLFVPSATTYGITSFIFLCYLTEWKVVMQYVPLYRQKYVQQPQEPKEKKC